MITTDLLLDKALNLLLPGFAVSLILGLLLWRSRLSGFALLGGFVAANLFSVTLPWFVWDEELGRFFLGMGLSLLTMLLPRNRVGGRLIGMVLVGLISGLILFPSDVNMLYRLAGAAASMLIYRALVDAEERIPAWVLLALLAALSGVTALVMIHSYRARLADTSLMWMSSCMGMVVAALMRPGVLHGVAGLSAVLFPCLIYLGRSSSDNIPSLSFLLLAAAPIMAMVCIFKLPSRINALLISILWLLCLMLAAVIAMVFEHLGV